MSECNPETGKLAWAKHCLRNVTLKIADRDHFTPAYVETGVLMVSPKDFDDSGNIDFSNCQYITLDAHLRNRRKTDIASGDVVFTNWSKAWQGVPRHGGHA